jgi:hypothetical protein
MTTLAVQQFSYRDTRLASLLASIRSGSPLLMQSVYLFLVGFFICLLLPLADDRLINGISVWHKPAKFFISLAVQLGTVSWAVSLLDAPQRQTRSIRWSIIAMLTAAWFEMAYIVFRSLRGEASHFNTATPLDAALYGLMGVGAVTLTLTAAAFGVVLWRNRTADIWREAAGLGLVLGSLLATVVGGYLSSQPSHWIGGDQTDATGLPLFFWSTTGGDLRVAHFVGLHAMQAVPFAAITGWRSAAWIVALGVVILTVVTFAQALLGMPLLRG